MEPGPDVTAAGTCRLTKGGSRRQRPPRRPRRSSASPRPSCRKRNSQRVVWVAGQLGWLSRTTQTAPVAIARGRRTKERDARPTLPALCRRRLVQTRHGRDRGRCLRERHQRQDDSLLGASHDRDCHLLHAPLHMTKVVGVLQEHCPYGAG